MLTDKKVAFYTLGCKLNFSETSTIARNFENEGFQHTTVRRKNSQWIPMDPAAAEVHHKGRREAQM